MVAFIEFVHREYSRAEVATDAKWLLLFIGAGHLEIGLLQAILSQATAIALVVAGVFYVVIALIPSFWLRFVLIGLWTLSLIVDFAIRTNPVSVFFIVVGVYHVRHMIRGRKNTWQAPVSV